ncbi:MAG: YceI family protein [Anaerolineae bacterium]|nr:YceI family protein [Anaerolineae bacterium]
MKRVTVILWLVLLAIGAGVGAAGMWWVLGGSGEPSEPISAPTLSLDVTEATDSAATEVSQLRSDVDAALGQDTAPANDSTRVAAIRAMSAQIDALENQMADLSTAAAIQAESMSVTATPLPPTSTPDASPTPDPSATPQTEAGLTGRSLFRIDPTLSEVRFIIHEELFGNPKEVIGSTDQVAGDIIVDFQNPANSQVGEIRINARTLETDDENRTRALRNQILQSRLDEFEFSTFVPTAISGMPAGPVNVGDTVTFELTGDLTVRNITNPVTFAVTATLTAENRLDGTASAMVTRTEYELTIPRAPGVANVTDDLALEITFVANLVESS